MQTPQKVANPKDVENQQGTWEQLFFNSERGNSWNSVGDHFKTGVGSSPGGSQILWEELFTSRETEKEKNERKTSDRHELQVKTGKVFMPEKIIQGLESLWSSIIISVETLPAIVLICGSSKGEGASVTSLYLALFLALKHFHKTVYVDLDMEKKRKPYIYKTRDEIAGFASYCVNHAPFDSVIIPTEHENLFIVPAWSHRKLPLSTVISRSERVQAFFKEAKENFEVIIVDGSPVLTNPGTALVGKYVDQVILTCRYGYTRYEVAGLAARKLKEAGAKRIAAVLTCREYPVPPIVYKLLK